MNTRNWPFVLAGLLTVSGVVSLSLWHELRAERQQVAGLKARLAEADSLALVRATAAPEGPPDARSKDVGNTLDASTLVAPEQAAKTAARPQNPIISEKELWKDPEYRKARYGQLRAMLPQQYPGVAAELGLDEKEANQLFDLLAENQLSTMMESADLKSAAAPSDRGAKVDLLRKQREFQRQRNESVSELLGNYRYSRWQQYQQTLPARTRASSIAVTLAQAGQPLDDAQLQSLSAALVAEQMHQRLGVSTVRMGPAVPDSQERVEEETRTRREESNRRILEAAAPQLSERQLAVLRAQIEQQDTISRVAARARERSQLTERW